MWSEKLEVRSEKFRLYFISNVVGRWLAAAVGLLLKYDNLWLKAHKNISTYRRDRARPCPPKAPSDEGAVVFWKQKMTEGFYKSI